MTQRLGFYGGTFDPIHHGHLNLAMCMLEQYKLDAVWFCPASRNPFKEDGSAPSAQDRLEMTALAIKPYAPLFRCLDIEVKRGGASYTYDTIQELTNTYPHQFHLILGEDSLASFSKWRNAKELLDLAPPLIGLRARSEFKGDPDTEKLLKTHLELMPSISMMDISSTEIRERIKKGLISNHLLPQSVIDYINDHQLYKN
jgi:nicotinate-nucleotide adenylyltransferase